MTTQNIRVSGAMMDRMLMKPFTADVYETDAQNAEKGFAVPRDRYPRGMWVTFPCRWQKRLPDFCVADGFCTVSAELACILNGLIWVRRGFIR